MSATLFKEVSYSLNKLLQDIELGEIGLPDIQRPFVWPNRKVRDLFDSMYRGFPIGYLLFWENALAGGQRPIGADNKQKVPRLLIVDGQQRLTSLFAVIKGVPIVREDYSTERVQIAFRPSDQTFEVADAAVQRNPEFIPDISDLWKPGGSKRRFVQDFFDRLMNQREVSQEEEDQLADAIDRLYDLLNFPFTALELAPTVDEEEVAEIFVRINSQGTTLNQADFILTLMSVFWDEGRKELEAFARESRRTSTTAASPYNYFVEPDPDQLLRVSVALGFRRARLRYAYSILRGKDLETEQFSEERRIQQFEVLKEAQRYVLNLQNWHDFMKVLMRAGFRHGKMITSQTTIFYTYALYLIGKRDFHVDHYTLRNVIARWFFMASLTGRYTDSPETTMEQDLARFRTMETAEEFVDVLDSIVNYTLTNDFWALTLPNELATSSSRSPSLFSYYAALNLLDARVLFSNMRVSELIDPTHRGYRVALERHHLFPRAYLQRNGVQHTRDINQIANYALVEWEDNSNISDMPPADYVPFYEQRFPQKELDQMYYWHALPRCWYELDYSRFLEERRDKMARVVRDGFQKLYG
jgi:hypothetical protein